MEKIITSLLGFCLFILQSVYSLILINNVSGKFCSRTRSFIPDMQASRHLLVSSKLASKLIFKQVPQISCLHPASPERNCIRHELISIICFYQEARTLSQKTQLARKMQFLVNSLTLFLPTSLPISSPPYNICLA